MIHCACGMCGFCKRRQRREARLNPTHCTCASEGRGSGKCDFCWNQIFERRHGEAAREYYEMPEGRHTATPLDNAAGTNGLDLRGLAGISRPAR